MPEPRGERPPVDRLDSWKEVAAYLRRDVKTVQRWEKREGMPVHRHRHDRLGSVFAFRSELDAWALRRRLGPTGDPAPTDDGTAPPSTLDVADAAAGPAERIDPRAGVAGPATVAASPPPPRPRPGSPRRAAWALLGAVTLTAMAAALLLRHGASEASPLEGARFVRLTDFEGIEQAAALSRDGRFVAFLSDRDGTMDVWVTQLGTDRFVNLTRGRAAELVNPQVRTLGFSPDGTLVTFWSRRPGDGATPRIDIWAAPLLGGPARPYLEGAAELDWSADGARLVFHTPGPGDPTFVRGADGGAPRQIFSAPEGLHAHFPTWSPDGESVDFVQGTVPDGLDLWRLPAGGGPPERLTHHDALVSHPVFLDARTLLYLASDPEGGGPWIHALDVETRASRRLGAGLEAYTSLAASADGRRLVATLASPKSSLWRISLGAAGAPQRIPLTTADGSAPRLGPGFLVYVAGGPTRDGVWKLEGELATELWAAPDARIVGGPAISRDGRKVAFTARQRGRTALWTVDTDGGSARVLTGALELRGAPAFAPDGRTVTVGAVTGGVPRLVAVPLDGGPPATLVGEHALDPAWSPGGDVVAYSGPDVGTTFPVRLAGADGSPRDAPALALTRGGRHVAFGADGRSLLVLHGGLRHKRVARVDLATGEVRPLAEIPPELDVQDFDVSPDGRELVVEGLQVESDLVLIERAGVSSR